MDATKGFICNLSDERRGDRGRGKTRQRGSQVAGQGMIRFKVTERVCRKTGGGKYRSHRRKRLEVGTPGGCPWRSQDPGVALEVAAGGGAERSLEERIFWN